ncbi:MAG TPA: pectate lyase [Cyclobacteriaceae bacterium]|nr:pectate lyase [Cyclobacteriaceae bacterium]
MIFRFTGCFCLLLMLAACQAQQSPLQSTSLPLAFRGAEGYGKFATGGRGGTVFIVTNLNDSGPGSLREAILKKGSRTIVFAVSGTIALESKLDIKNDNLTIAGQSAPGDGICIKNYPVKISASNVIIRYLRFRLGDERKVQDDAISGNRIRNVIIDHCSMSWAVDECASFYNNDDFTLQWCIISESLNASVHEKGDHGYGGIWGGRKASFHHNLLASHTSRLPRFSGSSTTPNTPDELVDFRNNVIYNWSNNNTYGGERGRYNVVGNYYKPGPATGKSKKEWMLNPSSPLGKFFVDENYLEGNAEVISHNWKGVKVSNLDSALAAIPFPTEPIATQSSEEAYKKVLMEAGASLRRDGVDKRIVEEVRKANSSFGPKRNGIINSQAEVGGWPTLHSIPTPVDDDKDGMADEWEARNKLNPKDPKDAFSFTLSKSYSNLEVYLDSLIAGGRD